LAKAPQGLGKLFDEIWAATNKWIDDLVKGSNLKDEALSKKNQLDEFPDGRKRHPKDNTRSGNFAEILAYDYFTKLKVWNGKKVNFVTLTERVNSLDDPIRKGIDGIFENSLFTPPPPPPKYIINEVKYNSSKLNKTITKSGGWQMSDKWIRFNIKNKFNVIKAQDILTNSVTMLSRVDKSGKVSLYELFDNATIKKLFKP
jgi:hypothetical protein